MCLLGLHGLAVISFMTGNCVSTLIPGFDKFHFPVPVLLASLGIFVARTCIHRYFLVTVVPASLKYCTEAPPCSNGACAEAMCVNCSSGYTSTPSLDGTSNELIVQLSVCCSLTSVTPPPHTHSDTTHTVTHTHTHTCTQQLPRVFIRWKDLF